MEWERGEEVLEKKYGGKGEENEEGSAGCKHAIRREGVLGTRGLRGLSMAARS